MAPRLSSDLERYPAPDAFERKPHGRSGTLRPNFSRRRLRPIGSQRRSPGRLGGHGDVGVDTRTPPDEITNWSRWKRASGTPHTIKRS